MQHTEWLKLLMPLPHLEVMGDPANLPCVLPHPRQQLNPVNVKGGFLNWGWNALMQEVLSQSTRASSTVALQVWSPNQKHQHFPGHAIGMHIGGYSHTSESHTQGGDTEQALGSSGQH